LPVGKDFYEILQPPPGKIDLSWMINYLSLASETSWDNQFSDDLTGD